MSMFSSAGLEYEYDDGEFVAEVGGKLVRAHLLCELHAKVDDILSRPVVATEAEEQYYSGKHRFEFFGKVLNCYDEVIIVIPDNTPLVTYAVSASKASANFKHRIRAMQNLGDVYPLFLGDGYLYDMT